MQKHSSKHHPYQITGIGAKQIVMNRGECMRLRLNNNRIIRSEEQASKHINILTHFNDDTLLDKSGKLIQIIKLSGLDFVTQDEQTLDAYKFRRNNLLKSFSSEFAFYFWQIRRKTIEYPAGDFQEGFAKNLNNKYKRQITQSAMFHTEHYLALITKQPEGLINKSYSIFTQLKNIFDKNAKEVYLTQRFAELNDVMRQVLSALSDYNCELLSVYEKNGVKFSRPLELMSQLINYDSVTIPLDIKNAGKILSRKRLFFNRRAGVIETRSADDRSKFSAILSIKAYTPLIYQGILDGLIALQCEYVITQSFRFYDRQVAKTRLRDQQKDMLQSKDESITQTEEIDEAFDDTASGEVGYGKHHFTLACYADNQEELNKQIGIIISTFSDIDITCVREDIASELSFWAQLPGNFGYICRAADISTKNMAAFASLHNYKPGKIKGNFWGDAVTVFETLSGSPYYFNFHYKDVGNFLVFGAMGSGKTLLIGFLIAQSMKFGGKRIIFDKDRGFEVLVSALRGTYERIKPGMQTGFNPCQLEDNPENRKFLSSLFKKMLTVNGESLTEADIEIIEKAINGLYRMDQPSRQLCHIASFFGAKKKGSLRARFDQWHSDGTHAWLFDNSKDSLNLNADVIGFDLGQILTDEVCKIPAFMYLLYRVEKILEGNRGITFFDEGWLGMLEDYLKNVINDLSRTSRKKNIIFGLATQVANDTVNAAISKSINESAFCKIFFPNPGADRGVYIDNFGLSEREFEYIKKLPDDQHYFLHVHGRSENKQSVVVRLNLSGMEDEIAIISAREETLNLFDKITSEVGKDPDIWLPIFIQRRKEMCL